MQNALLVISNLTWTWCWLHRFCQIIRFDLSPFSKQQLGIGRLYGF
jgi:hypothetical protein